MTLTIRGTETKKSKAWNASDFTASKVGSGNQKDCPLQTSHVIQNRLEQSSSFYSLLAYMDEKSKGDRKIERVYVNRLLSVFPCLSRKWIGTWSTGIPVSLSCLLCPPPHSGPHHYGGEPGSMWCLCSLCVCVCTRVLISCFIEEAVFACRDHYSDFFFFCEKRRTEKKDCQFSWICMGNN